MDENDTPHFDDVGTDDGDNSDDGTGADLHRYLNRR